MTPQNNVFAPFAMHNPTTMEIEGLNMNALVHRLLLFDTYYVQSTQLQDIAMLAEILGATGLTTLLESGALKIHPDVVTIGEMGQSNGSIWRQVPVPLPINQFEFAHMKAGGKEYVSTRLVNIDNLSMPLKQRIKLKRSIVDNLTKPEIAENVNKQLIEAFSDSMANDPKLLREATAIQLGRHLKRSVSSSEIELEVSKVNSSVFEANSNLESKFKLTSSETHTQLQRAFLSIGGLYQHVAYMNNLEAVVGFREEDITLLQSKFAGLVPDPSKLSSGGKEKQLLRILQIKGLPKLSDDKSINIDLLLRLKYSKECSDFRTWLDSASSKSDKEIKDAISSFSAKITSVLSTRASQIVKLVLLNTLPALITAPDIAIPTGMVLSTLDQFATKRLIDSNTPISFVNNSLPKLYKV